MVMSPYEWKIRVGWKTPYKQNNQHGISTRFRLTTNKMSNLKYHRIERNLQYLSISLGSHFVVWDLIHRYLAKILPIRRKSLSNQTIIKILFLPALPKAKAGLGVQSLRPSIRSKILSSQLLWNSWFNYVVMHIGRQEILIPSFLFELCPLELREYS